MQNVNDVMNEFIEIETLSPDMFKVVKETLTRMGVPSKKNGQRTLFQSVHVLQKRGKHYLVHFKCMFALDGRIEQTDYSQEDKDRLRLVAILLKNWGIVKTVDPRVVSSTELPQVPLTIVTYKDKNDWVLEPKYHIGKIKRG